MKFAGLALTVATLAVVFTLTAFAQLPGLRELKELKEKEKAEAEKQEKAAEVEKLPQGRPMEICQTGNGEGSLWDVVTLFGSKINGPNRETRKVQLDELSLVDGCQIIENALWVGGAEVVYIRLQSANHSRVQHIQFCDIPPEPVGQSVRCDPDRGPIEERPAKKFLMRGIGPIRRF